MSISESTISQSNYNYHLVPTDGFQTRVFPSLKYEIGRDPAELLLQLDYWITTSGIERDGHRWIKKSAKSISRAAFQDWSVTKVQRELRTLANEKHLIVVAYFDAPQDATPYIRLNVEAIQQLKSIHYVPTCGEIAAPPAVELPDPPADLPYPTAELPHPPAANLPGHIRYIDSPSISVFDDPIEKTKEKETDQARERESAHSADRAERDTNALKGKKQTMVGEDSDTIQAPEWDEFCKKMAEICGVDFEIKPGYIRTWASRIWKKGNGGAGYTVDDLSDFIAWWNGYDWRGAKNHTLPYPNQVVDLIRQSYDHESTRIRREIRARGLEPDDPAVERYRYISGALAEFINY